MNEILKYVEVKDAISYNKYDNGWEREQIFYTNSFSIGVDNRCSGCISHTVEDFVGPLKDCHRVIKGFGGTKTTKVNKVTIKRSWLDNI